MGNSFACSNWERFSTAASRISRFAQTEHIGLVLDGCPFDKVEGFVKGRDVLSGE
jgi:hypothetical protein